MEIPQLILCEISKEPIDLIQPTISLQMKLRYTNISELHFSFPTGYVDGSESDYKSRFENIKELRMIHVPNFGWFQIRDISEFSDGIRLIKECTAYSAESLLQYKQITNIDGEYKLYDPLKPYESIMGILMLQIPGWKIGNIDGTLLSKTRTLDVSKQNLYALLTNDIANAYECIFVFDYEKYEINIYDIQKKFKEAAIYVSYNNLIKNSNVTTMTDDIITALHVTGGNLDISGVNPNGSNIIYNVDYYKDRMSAPLLAALTAYESKYKALQETYSDLLLHQKNLNHDLALLKSNAPQYSIDFQASADGTLTTNPSLNAISGLDQLAALRKALEGVRAVRIEKGNITYNDVNAHLEQVDSMIVTKKNEITVMENEIIDVSVKLSHIVTQLKMENNFSDDEWVELNQYFVFNTLHEDSIIWTDIMTQEEKQEVQQELYDLGVRVLGRSSYPRYEIEIDSANFLALKEFEPFAKQFELGTTFYLDLDLYKVQPLLLEAHINFNNPGDFKLTFANKTMLDSGFSLIDYQGSVVKAINTISFDLVKLEAMKKQHDYVTDFINGSLDASVNELISSKNKTAITIDETGLRARSYDWDTEKQLGYEAWLTGSQLAFSNDNFTNAKLALGRVQYPGSLGGHGYGLVADVLAGRITATNNLHVSNDKNNFLLDETGAWLNNANFTITKGNNSIILNPEEGFSIYNGITSNPNNRQVYLGTDGNVYFRGQINGGSININNNFKVDSEGNLSAKNVDLTGNINATSGSFSGSINVNDRFVVNSSGACTAYSLTMTGGSINWETINSDPYTADAYDIANGAYNLASNAYDNAGKISDNMTKLINGTFNVPGSTFISGNRISSPNIEGGEITGVVVNGAIVNGSIINITGNSKESQFNVLDDKFNLYGFIRYDNNGAGTVNENKDRMYICTADGKALKIQSGANLSIEAKGYVYIPSKLIVRGELDCETIDELKTRIRSLEDKVFS